MRKSTRIVKKLLALFLVVLMSIESFGAVVSDNDGSAFITKAEFDSLKNDFQSQIDQYNTSIDSKIDGAIASYLAGVRVNAEPLVYYDRIKGAINTEPYFLNYLSGSGSEEVTTGLNVSKTKHYSTNYKSNGVENNTKIILKHSYNGNQVFNVYIYMQCLGDNGEDIAGRNRFYWTERTDGYAGNDSIFVVKNPERDSNCQPEITLRTIKDTSFNITAERNSDHKKLNFGPYTTGNEITLDLGNTYTSSSDYWYLSIDSSTLYFDDVKNPPVEQSSVAKAVSVRGKVNYDTAATKTYYATYSSAIGKWLVEAPNPYNQTRLALRSDGGAALGVDNAINSAASLVGHGSQWIYTTRLSGGKMLKSYYSTFFPLQMLSLNYKTYKNFDTTLEGVEENDLMDDNICTYTPYNDAIYGVTTYGTKYETFSTVNLVGWLQQVITINKETTDNNNYESAQWGANTSSTIYACEQDPPLVRTSVNLASSYTNLDASNVIMGGVSHSVTGVTNNVYRVDAQTAGYKLNTFENMYYTGIAGKPVYMGGGIPIMSTLSSDETKYRITAKVLLKTDTGTNTSGNVTLRLSKNQFKDGNFETASDIIYEDTITCDSNGVGNITFDIDGGIPDNQLVWLNLFGTTDNRVVYLTDFTAKVI